MDSKKTATFWGQFALSNLSEPVRYVEKDAVEEQPKTLADVIQEAWEKRMENNPEDVKRSLEMYLDFLTPEDRIDFLKEKLREEEDNGGTE